MATTLPAHVSLFTGTYTMRHGVETNFNTAQRFFESRAGVHSLAQIFAREGYQTAAFVSAAALKSHTGIQTGFGEFYEPGKDEASVRAGVTNEKLFRWLRAREERPLFLWVHYYDPHHPYDPPEDFQIFTADKKLEALIAVRLQARPDRSLTEVYDQYDGEIRYLDHEIGRLFAELRRLGLYDEAVIVVVGDHGEGLGQHGWLRHGHIYNEQLLVPLIIKFPADHRRNGTRHKGVLSIIDVPSTLDGAFGLPFTDNDRKHWQGIDVLGDEEREAVVSARVDRDRPNFESGRRFALTSNRWKYFHLTEHGDELYDWLNDPHEHRNVISEHPDVAKRMRDQILAHLALYEGHVPTGPPDGHLSDEVIEQLRQLGYAEE